VPTGSECRYVDASAIVKLAAEEDESIALRLYLEDDVENITSELSRTEVLRAARRRSPETAASAREQLHGFEYVSVDQSVLELAATLDPPELRALDAIHCATALSVARDLLAVVTYDRRMRAAAQMLGLPVESPA
jgi:predicted nucleic acid-binding protein